ncbi:hypothetical protein [Methanocaldococcus jannaschii]|nr:hypothetical protein [Methanocaldococcus jannaschii]
MNIPMMDLIMIVIAIIITIGSFLFIAYLIFKYSKIKKQVKIIREVKINLPKMLKSNMIKNSFLIISLLCFYFGMLYIAGELVISHILFIAICWIVVFLYIIIKGETRGYICEEGLLVSGVLYSWKEFKDVKIEDNYIILTTPIHKIVIKKEKGVENILKNYLKRN